MEETLQKRLKLYKLYWIFVKKKGLEGRSFHSIYAYLSKAKKRNKVLRDITYHYAWNFFHDQVFISHNEAVNLLKDNAKIFFHGWRVMHKQRQPYDLLLSRGSAVKIVEVALKKSLREEVTQLREYGELFAKAYGRRAKLCLASAQPLPPELLKICRKDQIEVLDISAKNLNKNLQGKWKKLKKAKLVM